MPAEPPAGHSYLYPGPLPVACQLDHQLDTATSTQDRYLSHAFEASTFLFFIAPVTVIGILYGLIGLAIRRSTLLTRVGSDASAPAGVMVQGGGGGGGARVERMLRVAGGAEQQRAQQLQTRARLAVVKMLGTCAARMPLSLSLSAASHRFLYTGWSDVTAAIRPPFCGYNMA